MIVPGKGAWALLAVALATAGCSTVNSYYDSLFGRSATVEKAADLVSFTPTATPRVLWQAAVGSAENYVLSPAVVGTAIYAASAAGQLSKFDAATGKPLWRIDVQSRISGGVGADSRLVVVGTPRGEVHAFDAGGKLQWKATLTSEILSAPRISDGTVIVRSGDSRVFGLDAADGRRKWVYQRATPALTVRSHAAVGISSNNVFAGFAGGRLVALSAATGVVIWEANVALPRGSTELERIADVTSEPLVDSSQVCAVAYQGRVACFEGQRGNSLWARDLSSIVGLGGDARALYVTDERNAVHGLDRSAGSSLWKQDRLAGRRVSGPQLIAGHVAVGDFQGYVHLLSRDTGAFAARIATDGSPVVARPVNLDGGILVQTRNGGLFTIVLP